MSMTWLEDIRARAKAGNVTTKDVKSLLFFIDNLLNSLNSVESVITAYSDYQPKSQSTKAAIRMPQKPGQEGNVKDEM
jgi:hypothetical protein